MKKRYACRVNYYTDDHLLKYNEVYVVEDYWPDGAAALAVEEHENNTCEFGVGNGREQTTVDVIELAEGQTFTPSVTEFPTEGAKLYDVYGEARPHYYADLAE